MASLHAPPGGSLVARVQRLWPLPHVRGDAGVILKSRQLATLGFAACWPPRGCYAFAAQGLTEPARVGVRAATSSHVGRAHLTRHSAAIAIAWHASKHERTPPGAAAYLARQRTRDESHESAARLHATSYCDLEQKVARRRTRRNTVTRFQSRQARKQA